MVLFSCRKEKAPPASRPSGARKKAKPIMTTETTARKPVTRKCVLCDRVDEFSSAAEANRVAPKNELYACLGCHDQMDRDREAAEKRQAVKACYDRAQATARELDPRCERVTQLAPCQYAVTGRKGDRYTVTVTMAGFTCTCQGKDHPACWHRADAMRFRFVQKCLEANRAATVKPVKPPVPRLDEMYEGLL